MTVVPLAALNASKTDWYAFLGVSSEALEPKETEPPSWAMVPAALLPAELPAALLAAVVAAADELDAAGVEAPVQLDSSGKAAAPATPPPRILIIDRRFMPVLRRKDSKSGPVTVDLRLG